MKKNALTLVAGLLFVSSTSIALESDYQQPIHVSSGTQHAKMQSNQVIFSKEVILTQGSIKITADKLTVTRGKESNQEIMVAEGNLATFYQTQDDGKPFDAQAKRIHYDVAKSKITLTGDAQIKQLESQINGSKIVYYIENEELIVENDAKDNKRVKTVFLPAQFEKKKDSESAAQATSSAPATSGVSATTPQQTIGKE